MRRRFALLAALAGGITLVGAAGAATPVPANGSGVPVTPVTRLPFPERGYVISVAESKALDARHVVVSENGLRVADVRVDALAGSGLRFGVVLAIDASESMTGGPAAAALKAGRTFLTHRTATEEIGIVAFNGEISVLSGVTRDDKALKETLEKQPKLAYGTRIYDAVSRSLGLLRDAKLSSGSIVLLSDGADIGSLRSLDQAVEAAKKQQVRIFTVGLRSGAYDPAPLRSIAERTGGAYAEARSAGELDAIYEELGAQLAGEYLVRYRSVSRPMAQVDVEIIVSGVGSAATAYVAPTPSLLPPYHRSALSKFLLSSSSPAIVSLVIALLVGVLLFMFARRPKATMVDRVKTFAPGSRGAPQDLGIAAVLRAPMHNQYTGGWWADLERDLELARMDVSPRKVVGVSLAGTVAFAAIAVALSAPLLGLFGLATPLIARAVIRRKLKGVRAEFAEQFPASLQVLASALRAGHSFAGALGVVVENAREPARGELARVLQDERLGVPPEDAIRKLARRMANRDIEQVALLAELQRTAGGNSAEVLDTVVATIRERAEIRRLVRTLTAQGRMSRWILTALPVFLAGFLWLVNPDSMNAFLTSSVGQVSMIVAALMVAAGSVFIQRIVDIDV
jgi:Flp pilus assembly protein TadB/Mg-chelatase subunit ChlD